MHLKDKSQQYVQVFMKFDKEVWMKKIWPSNLSTSDLYFNQIIIKSFFWTLKFIWYDQR